MPRLRHNILLHAAMRGAVAGVAGVAAMTVGEKLEQTLTGRRPNSYVPARTLLTLFGKHPAQTRQLVLWNHAMHWGTGIVLGALRGVWAVTGIRGPLAHAHHAAVRLAFDQTLENMTGAGAPPSSWPAKEQAVDIAHKGVYSLVAGLVADRWIPVALTSRRGQVSH
jgi:hypothetical protein